MFGPGGQQGPHLGEGLVLVHGVAAREHGRRAVEEVRDPEGQRAADDALLAQRVDDRVGRLARLTVTTTCLPGGPSALASSSYQRAKAKTSTSSAPPTTATIRRRRRTWADACRPAPRPGRRSGAPRRSAGVRRRRRARLAGAAGGVRRLRLVVGAAHARSSQAWSSTMAAALSTTSRAALPLRPAAASERCASTVVKRSSAVSTATPSGSSSAAAPRPRRARRGPPARPRPRGSAAGPTTTAAPRPRGRRRRWRRGRAPASPLRSIVPHGLASVRPLSL